MPTNMHWTIPVQQQVKHQMLLGSQPSPSQSQSLSLQARFALKKVSFGQFEFQARRPAFSCKAQADLFVGPYSSLNLPVCTQDTGWKIVQTLSSLTHMLAFNALQNNVCTK